MLNFVANDADRPGFHNPFAFPSMAMSAFTVELYLKCLVWLEGTASPWGHDLKELFDMVSPMRQAGIDRRFQASLGPETITEWKTRFPGFDGSAGSALALNHDFFQRARYAFDYVSKTGEGYLCCLLKYAIREVIIEVEPTWAAAEIQEGLDKMGRKRIAIDGKHLHGLSFGPDTVLVLRGVLGGGAIDQCRFEGCSWSFEGPVGVAFQLLHDIAHSSPQARAYIEWVLKSSILGPEPAPATHGPT